MTINVIVLEDNYITHSCAVVNGTITVPTSQGNLVFNLATDYEFCYPSWLHLYESDEVDISVNLPGFQGLGKYLPCYS